MQPKVYYWFYNQIYDITHKLKRSSTCGGATATCHPHALLYSSSPTFYTICQEAENYWSPKITYVRGLDILDISRVGDNLVELFAICVCNSKYHKQCPTALDMEFVRHCLIMAHTSLIRRYIYMVMTTFSMEGKEYEIEVEGEPVKDIKGAKDSAAMQAIVWFEDYGFVCQ